MSIPAQRDIIRRIHAEPALLLRLWALAEPSMAERLARGWTVRLRDTNLRVRGLDGTTTPREVDLVATLHRDDAPDSPAEFAIVVECPEAPDDDKIYSWPECLAAARWIYRAPGRVIVISPDDALIRWAHDAFDEEPELRPHLIGRALLERAFGSG